MTTASLAFLDALFAFAGCERESCLTLTAIHPARNKACPSRHVAIGDAAGLTDAVERLLRINLTCGYGAYVGVATRRPDLTRWQRGGLADLVSLPALFVDIDNVDSTTWKRISTLGLQPNITVSSGKGIHLYWLLSRPTSDFVTTNAILRALAGRLGGDSLTSAQCMRLVGTTNTKPTRNDVPCEILNMDCNLRYTLGQFTHLLHYPPHVSLPISSQAPHPTRQPSPVVDLVSALLQERLAGQIRADGKLASRCPCSHTHDAPGKHFVFDLRTGIGRCFGRHGYFSLSTLCILLGLDCRGASSTRL